MDVRATNLVLDIASDRTIYGSRSKLAFFREYDIRREYAAKLAEKDDTIRRLELKIRTQADDLAKYDEHVCELEQALDLAHIALIEARIQLAALSRLVVQRPNDKSKLSAFGVYHVGGNMYKAIRRQIGSFETAVKNLKKTYNEATRVFFVESTPNAVNILIRVRERIDGDHALRKIVTCHGTTFTTSDVAALIDVLKSVCNEPAISNCSTSFCHQDTGSDNNYSRYG